MLKHQEHTYNKINHTDEFGCSASYPENIGE